MKPVVVMQMDFGIGGGSAMYGTIKKVDPEVEVFEAHNRIEKFNLNEASRSLNNMVTYWPAGTIFVSVVDPGVGTSRRASVAKLKNGSYVVTPDNGTLTKIHETVGVEAIRVIDETRNRLKGTEKVSIFHGRDLFAYCAAKLASGIIDFAGVGPEYPVEEIVLNPEYPHSYKDGEAKGFITDMMRMFGNLETNIPIDDFARAGFVSGDDVHVLIKEKDRVVVDHAIPFRTSFGYVPEGSEVVYNSSDGVIGIGINKGSFLERYNIGIGGDWSLTITKEAI